MKILINISLCLIRDYSHSGFFIFITQKHKNRHKKQVVYERVTTRISFSRAANLSVTNDHKSNINYRSITRKLYPEL